MVKLRNPYAQRWWTKRKIRAIVLAAIVVWVLVAYNVKLVTYGRTIWHEGAGTHNVLDFRFPDYIPVRYTLNVTFETARDFSVGVDNPIHFSAVIYDVNRSDFGTLFTWLVFAYQRFETTGPASTTPAIPQTIKPDGQGKWRVEGEIAFFNQINFTGPILIPSDLGSGGQLIDWDKVYSLVSAQVKAYNYQFPTLQPQSFTDQLTKDETDARYGAMGSAVILVFLLPLFEGIIFGDKNKD